MAALLHGAPEQPDRYYVRQPRLESRPRVRSEFGEDREMYLPPYPVRRSVMGPDDGQIPPALGPTGGAGANGFWKQAQNPYLCTTPSESDRARWREAEAQHERVHEHASQLDQANLPPQHDCSVPRRGHDAGSACRSCKVEAPTCRNLGLARCRWQTPSSAGDVHNCIRVSLKPSPSRLAGMSVLAMPELSLMMEGPRNPSWGSLRRTALLSNGPTRTGESRISPLL